MTSPSAAEIAEAMRRAAPGEIGESRARIYALMALAHRWPDAPRAWLARALGSSNPAFTLAAARRAAAGEPWFELYRLNQLRRSFGWPRMTEAEARQAAVARRSAVQIEVRAVEPPAPAPAAPAPMSAATEPASAAPARATATPIGKPPARAIAEPRPASFDATFDMEIRYRPNRPAAAREVDIVTAELMGDPAPGRSALDGARRPTDPPPRAASAWLRLASHGGGK